MSKKFLRSIGVLLALSVLSFAGSAVAQQSSPPAPAAGQGQGPGQGRRGMGGPPPVLGTITSVGVDRFEIKKTDGTTQTVMVTDQTHYRQRQQGQGQPQELALEDLKVGDHVAVRGAPNGDKQLTAEFVHRLTAEQFERAQSMGGPGGGPSGPGGAGGAGGAGWGHGGGMGPGSGGPRAFGEITSIEGNTIKVHGRRGDHVIVVNDKTTFSKEGQPSSLKDFKVGDRIFATGTESNGQLQATEVRSGRPGGGGGGRGGFQGPPQN